MVLLLKGHGETKGTRQVIEAECSEHLVHGWAIGHRHLVNSGVIVTSIPPAEV
jgi:hypothetical protein